jgi:hypothetical protein
LKLRIFARGSSQRTKGDLEMGKCGLSNEEILRVLREADSGYTMMEICRKHVISQQTSRILVEP